MLQKKITIEVDEKNTPSQTMRYAELKYCNNYINKDCFIAEFHNLVDAKKYSGLKISSKIMD